MALRGGVEEDHAQPRHQVAAQDVQPLRFGVEYRRELLHGEVVKRRDGDDAAGQPRALQYGFSVLQVGVAADGGGQHQRVYRAAGTSDEVGADGAIDTTADAKGVAVEMVEVATLCFEPGDEVVNVGGEVHGVFRVWLEGLVVFVCEAGGVQLYIHLSARSVCKWVGGLSHVY